MFVLLALLIFLIADSPDCWYSYLLLIFSAALSQIHINSDEGNQDLWCLLCWLSRLLMYIYCCYFQLQYPKHIGSDEGNQCVWCLLCWFCWLHIFVHIPDIFSHNSLNILIAMRGTDVCDVCSADFPDCWSSSRPTDATLHLVAALEKKMKMNLILLISYGRSDKNNPINNSRCRTKLCPTPFTNYGLHFYLRIDQMVRKDMKGMGMQFNFENDLELSCLTGNSS